MTRDIEAVLAARYWPTDAYQPTTPAYPLTVTWDGVGTWPAVDWPAAFADAQAIYIDLATEADDPDFTQPDMVWRLGWHDSRRRRMTLVVDDIATSIHIDETRTTDTSGRVV